MRSYSLVSFLACGVAMACGAQESDDAQDPAAISAIERHNAAVEEALSTRDLEALMAEITDDAVWMPPGGAPLVGKEAIRSFYQELFAQVEFEGQLSPENQELRIFGDWAVFRGVLVGSVRPRGGGEPTVLAHKVVNVLHRDTDGSWKHVWDIWNSMPPPETSRALSTRGSRADPEGGSLSN